MEEELRRLMGSASRCDSESSAPAAMAYTDDRLTGPDGAGEPDNVLHLAAAPDNPDNESGELLDYNDASVLEQFHEDAMRQAGCGLAQARVVVAGGLAVAGAALELAAIPFILPSAEIELCILPHEKNWLVMISLVGGSLGALGWGALAARLGRRRVLLSCLAVNAVFAAIAAFMPTYGTFMMARCCSAIGSGGIVPTCYTYAGEMAPRAWRARTLAWLPAAAALGALAAAALAGAVLPPTGARALLENKEHFSAWHRYLLFCTLPLLASLVSLVWTRESPRFLLDAGREVDAMLVYQSIYSGNQVRICGARDVTGGAPASRLRDLTLPAKRAAQPAPHSLKLFWQAFSQLFSGGYRTTTLSLGAVLLLTMAIQLYLSSYTPATVDTMDSQLFEAAKKTVADETFAGARYTQTLENVEYTNTTFYNCTFRDLLMSHVTFRHCRFTDVAFSNIMTSRTVFRGCLFVNTTILDTDLEVGRELQACELRRSVLRGMRAACARADLASRLQPRAREQSYVAHAMLIAAVVALLPQRLRPTVGLCVICVLLSPCIYLAQSETALYIVEAVYRLLLTLVFFNVGAAVVDSYPANLRCGAHGLALSASYMAGAAALGAGAAGAAGRATSAALAALLAAAAAAAALPLRRR